MRRTSIQQILSAWFKRKKEAKAIITTNDQAETMTKEQVKTTTKEQAKTKKKTKNKATKKTRKKTEKMANSESMAKVKEKLKAESQARAEAEKRLKEEIKARAKAEENLKAESKKRQRLEAQAKEDMAAAKEETEGKIRTCTKDIKDCIELINSDSSSTTSKPNRGDKHADMKNTVDKKARKGAVKRKATSSRHRDKRTKSSEQGVSPAEMVKLVAKAEEKVSKAVAKAKAKDDKKAKGAK
jgi:hypothetical protein